MPIIVNAVSTGVICLQFLFSPSLPFAAVVFTLAVPCFGHCMCPFVLITCKMMGAKLDKVKNKQSKGQTEGKKFAIVLLY